jgi:hypothetical protein
MPRRIWHPASDRNFKSSVRSPKSRSVFRVCRAVPAAAGWAVTSARWTRRLRCLRTNSTEKLAGEDGAGAEGGRPLRLSWRERTGTASGSACASRCEVGAWPGGASTETSATVRDLGVSCWPGKFPVGTAGSGLMAVRLSCLILVRLRVVPASSHDRMRGPRRSGRPSHAARSAAGAGPPGRAWRTGRPGTAPRANSRDPTANRTAIYHPRAVGPSDAPLGVLAVAAGS